MQQLLGDPEGRTWVEALEAAKDPWFHFSKGTGLYHHERSWIDDLSMPWASLLAELDRLERGQDVQRPRAEILDRRERLASEYRALLAGEPTVRDLRREHGALRMTLRTPEQAGEINARLVSAGVVVTRLEPVRHSLEERFLEMTTRLEVAA